MSDHTETACATIWLRSSDKATFHVEKAAAECSILIKNLLNLLGYDDISKDNPIPIMNVNEAVLRKVMKWCDHHEDDKDDTRIDISEWDETFLEVDQAMLFEIISAANYLEIEALLDLSCKKVANMIKGESPDEMRRILNISNDFPKEEEDQVRRENEGAEE